MNIALETYVLSQKQLTGIGKTVQNYVKELQRLDTANAYFVYITDELLHVELTNKNWRLFRRTHSTNRLKLGISEIVASFNNNQLWMLKICIPVLRACKMILEALDRLYYFFRLEYSFKKYGIDLYISTSPQSLPKFLFHKPRTIGFIYDLVWILYPETMEFWNRFRNRIMLRHNLKQLDLLISISNNTRWQAIDMLGIRIPVHSIPLAADPSVYNCATVSAVKKTLKIYGITRPFILSVCTLEPRKNLTTLLAAYEMMRDREHYQLVLVGMIGWIESDFFDGIKNAGLEENIVLTGYVPDEDLAPLYSGAEVFVFPSLYEGFGLPVLEAMQCGCPVIASDTSAIPEVVGDAGIMVDPHDTTALAGAMTRVLSDAKLRVRLSRRGRARARLFSWQISAKRLHELIISKDFFKA